MADKAPQSFENHARILPAYHYVAFPLFAVNFFYMLYQVVTLSRPQEYASESDESMV